jgi:hypothetical protein
MKFYTYICLLVSAVCARTPIDTLAVERSDSGSKYVRFHVPYLSEHTVYTRYTVENIPANVVTELIDSAKGRGSVYIPPMQVPSRYALDLAVFSNTNTTWNYTLKIDTLTVFTAQSNASKIQIRTLEVYASPARNKLYLRRTNRGDDGSVSAIDSATFGNWGQPHRIYWTIQPSNPATLLGVRGSLEH